MKIYTVLHFELECGLLLIQMSSRNNTCYIAPLKSQKDGLSIDSEAEWVKAQFKLTDGFTTHDVPDFMAFPWALGCGGTLPQVDYKPSLLRVFPDISKDMRETLGLSKYGSIFFELDVFPTKDGLKIGSSATMVRKSAPEEAGIRKRMSIKLVCVSGYIAPKRVLFVSKA